MATRILLETFFDGLGGAVPTDLADVSAKYSRARTDGAQVVQPKTVEVQIVGGILAEPLLLAPTGVDFYCTLMIRFPRIGASIVRTVAIPDIPEVAWGDLVDIDPKTMQPSEVAVPAWEAAVAQVQAALDAVSARTLTATVDPSDPDVLILSFPAFMVSPTDSSILILPIGENA